MTDPDKVEGMHLKASAFDLEIRPDGVKLQFVDEKGEAVQVTIPLDRYESFRQAANHVANRLVREAAEPLWIVRKPPHTPSRTT